METRIAGVTGSQDQPFYELLHPGSTSNPSAESNGLAKTMDNLDIGKDLLLPSYSKPQPIHDNTIFGSSTGSNSVSGLTSDDKSAPPPPSPPRIPLYSSTMHSSNEYCEPAKGRKELDRDCFEAAMMASVESTMKKYADNLLCSLEAISGKLSQLEYTTQHLESSMEELKQAVGNSHGETDGRMRLLENILREVQTGVQLLRDKQEISEARSQLKSQFLKNDYSDSTSLQESSESKPIDTQHQIGYAVQQQPVAPFSLPSAPQPSHSAMTSNPPLPPPSHQSGISPTHAFPAAAPQQAVSLQSQSSSTLGRQQMLPTTTVVPSESSYQSLPQQSSTPLPPPPPPPHQYQVPSHMQQVPPNAIQMSPYSQQPQQQQPSSQAFSPPVGQSELPAHNLVHPVSHPQMPVPTPLPPSQYGPEPPYMPTSYGGPNSQQQPRSMPPTQIPLSSPQGFTGGQPVYESSFGRTGSGPLPLASAYGRGLPGPMYGDSQSYGSPPFRVPQVVPSAPSGGIGHPRLPSAKPVQHSLPIAASVSSSPSGSTAPSNRVPVDDVVDRVTAMGFSREQVRAVVRKLTENGQSVDLNVVLDKLMNGGEIQPQKGWFGR